MLVYPKKLILFIFILSPIKAKRITTVKPKIYTSEKSVTQPWWKKIPNAIPGMAPLIPLLSQLNLPVKNDLDDYLASLKAIVGFCLNHKSYVDVNLAFGLLLTNVHLKPLLDGHKLKSLSSAQQEQLKNIVSQSDEVQKFYKENTMLKKSFDTKIGELLFTESIWVKRLPFFNTNLLNETVLKSSKFNKKSSWSNYYEAATDPKVLDNTMVSMLDCWDSLQKNPYNHAVPLSKCTISKKCQEFVMSDTDFGYNFIYRFLALQHAYFARGCYIFSDHLDKEIRNSICATAYLEADFISKNKYGILDVMLGIVSFCALDGNAQFLRSHWLKDIRQQFQVKDGCVFAPKTHRRGTVLGSSDPQLVEVKFDFNTNIGGMNPNGEEKIYRVDNLDHKCDRVLTSLASSTFAAAVRFAIETSK